MPRLKYHARSFNANPIGVAKQHGSEAVAGSVRLVSRDSSGELRKGEIAIGAVLPDTPPVIDRKEEPGLKSVASFDESKIVVEIEVAAIISAPRVATPGCVLTHCH